MALAAVMAFALSAAFLLFLPFNTAHAAYGGDGDWVTVDEIYSEKNSKFNERVLKELYTVLAGAENFDDLSNKVSAESPLTSENFRNNNGGKNVSVWFGGKKWDAVYLTKDKSDNIVLDLWQSADNVSKTSQWANHAENDAEVKYPSNMYSTSLIRVDALNNGGYVSTSGSALAEKTEQDPNDEYARFTMLSAEKSLVKYIVQPKDIAYQETENAQGNISFQFINTCPNDVYGTPSGERWYNDDYNYAGKGDSDKPESMYEAWKEDYLWLPSLAETGNRDSTLNGLWKTNSTLRSTVSLRSTGTSMVQMTWLRSGYFSNATNAYYLDITGTENNASVSAQYCVRPALHLNLTEVNTDSEEFIETVTAEWKSDYSTTFYATGGNIVGNIADCIEVKTQSGRKLKYPADYTVTAGGSDQIKTAGKYTVTITMTDESYRFAGGVDTYQLPQQIEVKDDTVATVTINDKIIGFGTFGDAYGEVMNYSGSGLKILLKLLADDLSFNDWNTLTVSNYGECTFDLNGHTLTATTDFQVNVSSGTFILTDSSVGGNGKIAGKINVSAGGMTWGGGGVDTIALGSERVSFISVQDNFKAPAVKIGIKTNLSEVLLSKKVLSWAGETDPVPYFKCADGKSCLYKGKDENAAYVGKHTFVHDGSFSWTEDNSKGPLKI